MISASEDYTVRVWGLRGPGKKATLLGQGFWALRVAMSNGGRIALASCEPATVKVWDLERWEQIAEIPELPSFDDWGIAICGDERQAVFASGHMLKVWDLENQRELGILAGHLDSVNNVAVSDDGRRVVSASNDCTVRLWNLDNMQQITAFTSDVPVTSCAVTPDGKTVIAGDVLGRIFFCD